MQMQEENRLRDERRQLESIENDVERFEKLIVFDEKVLSDNSNLAFFENVGEGRSKFKKMIKTF